MTDEITSNSIISSNEINYEKSSQLRHFAYDCLIIIVFIAVFYVLCILNFITGDTLDRIFSLYPHSFKKLWNVFTCTFVHDDIHHLHSYVVLFFIVSVCVLSLKGRFPFFVISSIIIITGNLISWCIGKNRMNGVSSLSFGLLSYIYLSVVVELGLPLKCTAKGLQYIIIAFIISVLYWFLNRFGLISTATASWQYNISGCIGSVFAIYILHIPSVARFVGLPVEEQPKSEPEEKTEHRAVVGKKLMKFSDLRKPLV